MADYFFLPPWGEEVLFKHDFFYYYAESKQLYHVNKNSTVAVSPGFKQENIDKWEIISIGLSPIKGAFFVEMPGKPNSQKLRCVCYSCKKNSG